MAQNDRSKNGGNLGFEAADKLRGNIEPSDYSFDIFRRS